MCVVFEFREHYDAVSGYSIADTKDFNVFPLTDAVEVLIYCFRLGESVCDNDILPFRQSRVSNTRSHHLATFAIAVREGEATK